MGLRLLHQNPVAPGAATVPGTKTSPGTALARTLRTHWWPRVLLAGVVLVIVGVALLSGTTQGVVVLLGAAVFAFAAAQGLMGKSWNQDRGREPPVPPGSGHPRIP